MDKYSGIDNINKPAFDAIVPRVKEAIESGEIATGGGELIVEDYSSLPTETELGTLKDGVYKLGANKKYYVDNLKGSTATNSILEMNYYGDRKYITLTGNISIVFIGGVIIQVTVFYDKYEK